MKVQPGNFFDPEKREYWFLLGLVGGAVVTLVLLDTYGLILRGDVIADLEAFRRAGSPKAVAHRPGAPVQRPHEDRPQPGGDRVATAGVGAAADTGNGAGAAAHPDRPAEAARPSVPSGEPE